MKDAALLKQLGERLPYSRVATVSEILSIPASHVPLCVVPLGYPAEDPSAKDKWDPAKIHRDRW